MNTEETEECLVFGPRPAPPNTKHQTLPCASVPSVTLTFGILARREELCVPSASSRQAVTSFGLGDPPLELTRSPRPNSCERPLALATQTHSPASELAGVAQVDSSLKD